MPSVKIHLHAEGPPDLETTDAATVQALRQSFPSKSNLVMAYEVEPVLRKLQPDWAKRLEGYEEAHMVRIEFIPAGEAGD